MKCDQFYLLLTALLHIKGSDTFELLLHSKLAKLQVWALNTFQRWNMRSDSIKPIYTVIQIMPFYSFSGNVEIAEYRITSVLKSDVLIPLAVCELQWMKEGLFNKAMTISFQQILRLYNTWNTINCSDSLYTENSSCEVIFLCSSL